MFEDDRFSAEPSHAVAKAMEAVMSGIHQLRYSDPALVQQNIDDLKLSYTVLGHLLDSVSTGQRVT